MASTYADTALLDAVMTARANDTFQAFETKGSVYGALDAGIDGMSRLLPAETLKRLKQSDNQPLKIDVLKKEDEGVATTFSCSTSGNGETDRGEIGRKSAAQNRNQGGRPFRDSAGILARGG